MPGCKGCREGSPLSGQQQQLPAPAHLCQSCSNALCHSPCCQLQFVPRGSACDVPCHKLTSQLLSCSHLVLAVGLGSMIQQYTGEFVLLEQQSCCAFLLRGSIDPHRNIPGYLQKHFVGCEMREQTGWESRSKRISFPSTPHPISPPSHP